MNGPSKQLTSELKYLAHTHYASCSQCGRDFSNGDAVYLGYSAGGEPLYVGECCTAALAETVLCRRFVPRPYQTPPPDALLWRYMDFTKFVALISKKALFLSRADRFEDPFEGARGLVERKREWESYYLGLLIDSIKRPGEGLTPSDEELKRRAEQLLDELETSGRASRSSTFISCWHENDFESEAMWALYSTDRNQAVAITSTYRKLTAALGRDPELEVGRVAYIDFNRAFADPGEAFWRKRKSYEHEREVRAIIHQPENRDAEGVFLTCDLDVLIGEVFLAPTAPRWLMDLVIDLMKHYGVQKPVRQSSIRAMPFY